MTSEQIIEKLLHKKQISVREAMILMKDCVNKQEDTRPCSSYEGLTYNPSIFTTDKNSGLLNQITYTTNSNSV